MGSVKEVVLVTTAFDPNLLIDSIAGLYSQSPERQLNHKYTQATQRADFCLGNFSMGHLVLVLLGNNSAFAVVCCCVTLAVGTAPIIDE